MRRRLRARTLDKMGVRFIYEPKPFTLTDFIHYTPDFYLPDVRKNNKIVLLEPHGLWTRSEKRFFFLGNKYGSCQAPNRNVEQNEREVVWKYAEFRKQYGKYYHLILFVPSNNYEWVKTQYKQAYDEVYTIGDFPKVLTQLTYHYKRRLQ